MANTKQQYNIYDIARELNLSPGTISKVINNSRTISEKTKIRVREYIKKIDYVPNVVASSLKSKISMSIGVAYPSHFKDLISHFFFSKVIEYFRGYVEEKGYEFSFVTNYLGTYKVSYLDYVRNRNYDGILIMGATSADTDVMELIENNIACVSIDQISNEVPFVQTNDILASQLIIDYLKEQKVETVDYISGPYTLGDFKKRTNGFVNQLRKNDMNIHRVYQIDGTYFDSAFNCTKGFYENNIFPSVIVASNDEIAMGIIRALESLGKKVPEDVMVIGFDDMYFAKYFTPSLTTIAQNCEEIGRIAGERLIDIINKKENVQIENYINCELIVRDSTRKKVDI